MATPKRPKGSAKRVTKRRLTRKKHGQVKEKKPRKFALQQGWLKEVWGKWPGNEPIEELLAALKRSQRGMAKF